MHGDGKSYSLVVLTKLPNKAASVVAEAVEERGLAKGKTFIRLFQQDTTYSVWACHGRRFPEACVNFSVNSPVKRPVRNIWQLVAGLTGLSVQSAGTSVRMS
jgi:hypothetical protein